MVCKLYLSEGGGGVQEKAERPAQKAVVPVQMTDNMGSDEGVGGKVLGSGQITERVLEGPAQQEGLTAWIWVVGAREVKDDLACFQPEHLRED